MKVMLKFADQSGRLYYATSFEKFVRFSGRNRDIKTAVFQGLTQVPPKFLEKLEKLENGIFKRR